ncbi:TetR/AcrR family transcriptional regulator [Streptomyces collinus]|uniref:TetR/AcrR family transcriptional regulator n=1 Tax=Streptomyces collinus TaxID=42684 RepID=UPI003321E6C1
MGAAAGPRRRRRDGVLTRKRIIDAAAEISTAEGPDGVTFRALGSRLGVVASAIYRHFHDKDELMLALADQIFVEIADRFHATGDWEADLCRLSALARTVCRRHAFTVAWLGHRTTGGPGARAVALITLRLLLEASLTPEQAYFHYVLLTDLAMGILTVEVVRESPVLRTRRRDDDVLADLACVEPRLSELPTIAADAGDVDYCHFQLQLHIEAIRATASGNAIVAPAGRRG